MAKKRVHEIAKAQGLSSKELLAALKAAGIEAKAAASSVEEADALKAIQAAKGDGGAAVAPRPRRSPKAGAPNPLPTCAKPAASPCGAKAVRRAEPAAAARGRCEKNAAS